MRRAFIFSAGSFYGTHLLPQAGDLVIAADAGLLLCEKLNIVPDLVIGDFDSMDQPDGFENCERVPVEKDDTDTMLAVKRALDAGCEELHLYGGTGGKRLDHTLANLQTLAFICRRGARGFLYDDHFTWTVIENTTLQLPRTVDWGLLSLFAMDSTVEDITLTGLQYPLAHARLSPGFPLGVSNHIVEPLATVTCGSGLLLVGYEVTEGRFFCHQKSL